METQNFFFVTRRKTGGGVDSFRTLWRLCRKDKAGEKNDRNKFKGIRKIHKKRDRR